MRFHTLVPHQKIVTDTTEFKYYEVASQGRLTVKKLYLDPYLDMYNSEVVSFSISKQPNGKSVMTAIEAYIYYYNNERIKSKLN